MPEWLIGILCIALFIGGVYLIRNKDKILKK
jgi:hypothetical protein